MQVSLAGKAMTDFDASSFQTPEERELLYNIVALDVQSNLLTHVKGLQFLSNLTSVDVSHNRVSSLVGLPLKLRRLNCSYNSLESLDGLSALRQLEWLDASYNSISQLHGLPQTMALKTVLLSHNRIVNINAAAAGGAGGGAEIRHYIVATNVNTAMNPQTSQKPGSSSGIRHRDPFFGGQSTTSVTNRPGSAVSSLNASAITNVSTSGGTNRSMSSSAYGLPSGPTPTNVNLAVCVFPAGVNTIALDYNFLPTISSLETLSMLPVLKVLKVSNNPFCAQGYRTIVAVQQLLPDVEVDVAASMPQVQGLNENSTHQQVPTQVSSVPAGGSAPPAKGPSGKVAPQGATNAFRAATALNEQSRPAQPTHTPRNGPPPGTVSSGQTSINASDTNMEPYVHHHTAAAPAQDAATHQKHPPTRTPPQPPAAMSTQGVRSAPQQPAKKLLTPSVPVPQDDVIDGDTDEEVPVAPPARRSSVGRQDEPPTARNTERKQQEGNDGREQEYLERLRSMEDRISELTVLLKEQMQENRALRQEMKQMQSGVPAAQPKAPIAQEPEIPPRREPSVKQSAQQAAPVPSQSPQTQQHRVPAPAAPATKVTTTNPTPTSAKPQAAPKPASTASPTGKAPMPAVPAVWDQQVTARGAAPKHHHVTSDRQQPSVPIPAGYSASAGPSGYVGPYSKPSGPVGSVQLNHRPVGSGQSLAVTAGKNYAGYGPMNAAPVNSKGNVMSFHHTPISYPTTTGKNASMVVKPSSRTPATSLVNQVNSARGRSQQPQRPQSMEASTSSGLDSSRGWFLNDSHALRTAAPGEGSRRSASMDGSQHGGGNESSASILKRSHSAPAHSTPTRRTPLDVSRASMSSGKSVRFGGSYFYSPPQNYR